MEINNALLDAAEGLAQLIEVAVGHRERCIAQGFSPTMAEMMAVHLHNELVAASLRSTIK